MSDPLTWRAAYTRLAEWATGKKDFDVGTEYPFLELEEKVEALKGATGLGELILPIAMALFENHPVIRDLELHIVEKLDDRNAFLVKAWARGEVDGTEEKRAKYESIVRAGDLVASLMARAAGGGWGQEDVVREQERRPVLVVGREVAGMVALGDSDYPKLNAKKCE
jgi:hypothetical protein